MVWADSVDCLTSKFAILSGLLEKEQALLLWDDTINPYHIPCNQAKKLLLEAYQRPFYKRFWSKTKRRWKTVLIFGQIQPSIQKVDFRRRENLLCNEIFTNKHPNILKRDYSIKSAEDLAEHADVLWPKCRLRCTCGLRQAKKHSQTKD